jgi:hypothetical protein
MSGIAETVSYKKGSSRQEIEFYLNLVLEYVPGTAQCVIKN